MIIYASGAAINIEEYDPAITQNPTANAKVWIIPEPNQNIKIITNNVENEVARDLLIVCHTLSSNTFLYTTFSHFLDFTLDVTRFSLILSKIIIVSLILYPIQVRIAIIKTVSTWIVLFIAIQIPYAHAGSTISKSIVPMVIIASVPGEI